MGEVYHARDKNLRCERALNLLPETLPTPCSTPIRPQFDPQFGSGQL